MSFVISCASLGYARERGENEGLWFARRGRDYGVPLTADWWLHARGGKIDRKIDAFLARLPPFADGSILAVPPAVPARNSNKLRVPLVSGVGTAAEVGIESRWVIAITYRFDSLQDAKNYCSALERQLRLNRLTDVLVDARKHEHQTREATDAIWQWVDMSPHLERMALIVESDNLSLAIKMRSLASPTRKVRPFKAKLEAEKWLLSGEGVILR